MDLRWLGEQDQYVTWGVPHKKGTVLKGTQFVLKGENDSIPLQTKENAYWPDGSVKWTLHHAAICEPEQMYRMEKGQTEEFSCPIIITQTENAVCVNTGVIQTAVCKKGTKLIDYIQINGVKRCAGGRLTAQNENRFQTEGYETTTTEQFVGDTTECIVEESGPIRAVIRVRGSYACRNNRSRNGNARRFLPFDLRMYFYAGCAEIKVVHTFLFDGEQHTDFIKALGIEFDVCLTGALYNRYVRFAGERGLYADSPKGLLTWRTTGKYHDLYAEQNECHPVSFDEQEDEKFLGLLDESAVWNDFKIKQLSSEEYAVEKRTQKGCVYIKGHMGKRALGGGYLGDSDGGIGVHLQNFWQKYPSCIECTDTTQDTAKLTIWMWPPEAQPMDLRHYDTRTHVYSGYEGFEEMRATPYGIGNTNEMSICLYGENPSNAEVLAWIQKKNKPVLLIPCDLQDYNRAEVLGEWSLDDRSTEAKRELEEHNDSIIAFYRREQETRRWFGFWDYGDFMHTYDDVHHCWKYDMGGQAWQNTELVPNLWLWYGFLRSGREDVFCMAKDMTRHTSEVDMYHIGQYAPLGSRHNVVHWGCACKESRIGMAHLHKIYYYLTGDERIGDILDESVDVDYAVGELDPMRAYYTPSTKFKTHVRFGPDVMSFCSNWFTYWERHESTVYRDKLLKTLEFFKQGHRFVLSGVYGYDPQTTTYHDFQIDGGSHFMHCFGNFYVWLEIANCLEDDEIKQRLMDLGQFYGESEKDKAFRLKKCREWGFDDVPGEKRFRHESYDVGIGAFAAKHRNDSELAEEIWHKVYHDSWLDMPLKPHIVDTDSCHKVFTETLGISTNAVGQWGTNVFLALHFIDEFLK